MKRCFSILVLSILPFVLFCQNADQYFMDGCNFVIKGKYKNAVKSFTATIEEDSTYEYAYINRASVYALMRKHKKAISDLNIVIDNDPTAEFAYETRGYEFHSIKKYNKAISDYNQILELNPENTDVYFPRGLSFYKLKKFEKAIEDFEKALISNEDGETYYYLALCYKGLDNKSKCCENAIKAQELEYHKSLKRLLKTCD